MTLTQAATLTKRGIITTIVLAILSTVGIIGYNAYQQYQLSKIPPVEEKPEMKFGQLPKLIFPNSAVSSSNYSYSLDTVTGGLPPTLKMIKVYFIPQAGISLLAPEKSRKLAENFNFTIGPEVLSQTKYKFTDESGGELFIDLSSGNFNFQKKSPKLARLDFIEREEATNSAAFSNLLDKEKVVADFKIFLSSKNLLTEELSSGRSNVVLDNETKSAVVSLWPKDFDNLPIKTASFTQGLVKAVVVPSEEDIYQQINYTFWIIDKTTFSTYPLKTAEKAFADLKSGQGFISIEPKNPQVSISSVYLAYYQTEEYSPYLQPVFIFEGPDFAALVPAIDAN